MLLSNLFRILNSYKFSIFKIIFFEILYIVKGYKGNKFNLTKNETMSDNIPCPYYFLMKIKKVLKQNGFKTFLDLGSGSGRTIDFFNKNFSNCEFIGVEYLINQCNESKKIFANNKNIKIIQSDFTKINLTDLKPDCLYLNNPFRNYNQTED